MDSRTQKWLKMDSKSDPRKMLSWTFFFDVLTQGGPSRLQSLPQSAFGMHFDRFLEANVSKIIARRRMYPQIHVCRCLFAARAYDAYSAMNIHCKLSFDINRSS